MKLIKIIPITCSISIICGSAYAFNKIQVITPAEFTETPPPAQFDPNATYYASKYHPKLKICTQTDLSYHSVSVSFTMDKPYRFYFSKRLGLKCTTDWLDRKATVSGTLDIFAELRDSEGTLQTPKDQLLHTATGWNGPEECLIMNINPPSLMGPNPHQIITFEETTGC